MNIVENIKRKKHLVYAAVGITAVTLTIVLTVILERKSQDEKAAQSPTPSPTVRPTAKISGEWGNINSVIQSLGGNISDTPQNPDRTDQIKSNSASRKHEVVYSGNQPVYVKEVVTSKDGKTSTTIKGKFGQAELVMYKDEGFALYSYPSKGIAYVAGTGADTLFEIWYFAPTEKETFGRTWAKGYSLSLPTQNRPF